jgi:hypothetical protein
MKTDEDGKIVAVLPSVPVLPSGGRVVRGVECVVAQPGTSLTQPLPSMIEARTPPDVSPRLHIVGLPIQ